MPIQLNYTDRHKVTHPEAYAKLKRGTWEEGSGGFQITVGIYASQAAMEAGGEPVHTFDRFVPFDSSGMNSGIEQAIMTLDENIAAGEPKQVP